MIAIPNMDKPKSCWECRLMDGEANCLVIDEGIPFKQEGIYPDCPLIDIVQCKDCKWLGIDDGMTFCNVWLREVERHMFCSYGERRADGDI